MGLSASGSSIKSIQRGTVTVAANTTSTATISAVNTAKAEVRLLGWNGGGATVFMAGKLLNSTTIQVNNTGYGSGGTYEFEVTEWN